MIIVIIGSGGRENILIEKLNNGNNKLYCIGSWKNPDIIENTEKVFVINSLKNSNLIFDYCKIIEPDIIVIGPETVLETDFVDQCNMKGYKCIGPSKLLAQLETSKYYTRKLLTEIDESIFNPNYFKLDKSSINEDIIDFVSKNGKEIVIKVDGLEGGKGVFVQGDHFKDLEECKELLQSKLINKKVLVEEKLIGEEFSLFTFSDGENFIHLPPIQDYKRAYNNNEGPNTGGMGSILNDFSFLNKEDIHKCHHLNSKVLNFMKSNYKMKYVGILYGSYMKTVEEEIKLIEFNCRFGDSEVFNVLNIIDTDLTDIFLSMVNGKLGDLEIKLRNKVNIVKYLVPEGYPIIPKKKVINYSKVHNVYSASIDENNNLLGSRSIAVFGEGDNLKEAFENCENLIKTVNNDNLYWRKDIGYEKKIEYTYKDSGVDVDKGNSFVKLIKNDVELTYNENVIGKHGNFGGQYNFKESVLVASTDGVGTKGILIKKYTGDYYTCGHDIVNHSINDILVQGAKPMFFLDYVASSKLDIGDTTSFVKGCCDACRKINCVLLGGETAEMPTVYNKGHMDMVGTIVGEKVIEIGEVEENDLYIGLPSTGPQTNGYTLIRRILEKYVPPKEILEFFLTAHGSFLNDIFNINKRYKIGGMCHITGGGLTENLKRTIPEDLEIDLSLIKYPKWCNWLKEVGDIQDEEMRKTFNCGIGFFTFIKPIKREKVLKIGILGSTKCTVMDYIINAINNSDSLIYKKIEIVKVISNKKASGILDRSRSFGLKSVYIPKDKNVLEDVYYDMIDKEFKNDDVELILCIGWMKIIPLDFIKKWENKCINVHPSLLPKYAGGMNLDVHNEVIKNKDKESGCTVHIITEEVDKGQIIIQKKCCVNEEDTPETLKFKVQCLEGECLIETLYFYYNNLINFVLNGSQIGLVKKKIGKN